MQPIVLPEGFAPAGIAFWNWIYNDVFAHPTGPIKRSAHWDGTGVDQVASRGGIEYRWQANESISTLMLWTGDRSAEAVRSAVTDVERPPFSLLCRVWFDLARLMGLLTDGEWEGLCERVEQMKPHEYGEYGQSW